MSLFRSIKTKIKLKRLAVVVVIFTLVGIIDGIFTHWTTSSSPIIPNIFPTSQIFFWVNALSFSLAGLAGGALLIFVLKDRFRDKPFPIALAFNSSLIFLTVTCVSLLVYLIYFTWKHDATGLDQHIVNHAWQFLQTPIAWKTIFFGFILVLLTIIGLRVNDKYGPGTWLKLLLGRFHQPFEEERIFMFVDLKASTTIAEKLGHIRYHNLLNDFFKVITDPIIYSEGEIYQYVGDEIIISWAMPNGVRHANCINCFFWMQNSITEKSEIFESRYGLVPEFKAGLHTGIVTTGEIGVIKRDVVYSGDVLNTASRIQQQCNELNVKILLSERLLGKLQLPPHLYHPEKMGEIKLKGRMETIVLHTV